MVKYKKETRDIVKSVKLTKTELEILKKAANEEGLALATIIREYALRAIRIKETVKQVLDNTGAEVSVEILKKQVLQALD